MSQSNSNEKNGSVLDMIGKINEIPGFNPAAWAVN